MSYRIKILNADGTYLGIQRSNIEGYEFPPPFQGRIYIPISEEEYQKLEEEHRKRKEIQRKEWDRRLN